MIDVVEKFKDKSILVIGDIMLDEYIVGSADRISPEAPVPILRVLNKFVVPGGAANVANNILSLGANVTLVGQAGKDRDSVDLIDALDERKIPNYIVHSDSIPTIKKTRVLGMNQQLLRIDNEDFFKPSEEDISQLSSYLKNKNFDAVIVSDYNKGFICESVMSVVSSLGIKIFVDPKPNNIDLFHNCFVMSPNHKEAFGISHLSDVNSAGFFIRNKLNCNVVVTQGKDGATLFSLGDDVPHSIHSVAKNVFDVSGAGDTFISVLTLGSVCGLSLKDSISLANIASGISVGKVGTATVSVDELKSEMQNL